MHESDPRHVSDEHSGQSEEPSRVVSARPKRKHADKEKTRLGPDTHLSPCLQKKISPLFLHRSSKPTRAPSDQDQPQHDPDPLFYREVAMADLPSQYAEEVETFRRILNLPDPRETMPRSSTFVLGLDNQKGQEALLLCSHLVLSSHKDAFDKFEHDFFASDLLEGKYIKPPPSTAKWYKVGQPCYEDKIQELNTDLSKICISPKPSAAPICKFPLLDLKELEHQARQNLSTINFMAACAKT